MRQNRIFSAFITTLYLSSFLTLSAYGVEFKAEKVSYDIETSETICEDNVVVSHEGDYLASDKARVNVEKNTSHAEGQVLVQSDGEMYLIDDFDFNFKTKSGVGHNGTAYKYPWILKGEKIEKRGKDIIVTNAVLKPTTTIKPLVTIKAKEAKIQDNKYLVLKHVTYYIGPVPVFWFPYFKKNISDQRSGFTFTPGRNSNYGLYAKTSYRHWLGPDVYGRVNLDVYENRGIGVGAELGIEQEDTDALLRSYYIRDKEYDPTRADFVPGDKEDRYALDLDLKQNLPKFWTMYMQGNKQSDIDFYDDFFYDDFRDNIQKQNFVSFAKSRDNINLNLYIEQRYNDFFTVLEKEPQLTFDLNNYMLEEYNIFHKFTVAGAVLDLRYANDAAEHIDVNRLYMRNEVSMPLKFGWLSVKPLIDLENLYYDDSVDNSSAQRNIVTGDIDLFVKMYKAMYPEKRLWGNDRFRHVFEPHVTYSYRPEPNFINDEIYQLDGIDNRPEINQFKIDLRNLLQAKTGEQEDVKTLISGSFFIFYYPDESEFSNIGYQWDLRLVENLSLDLWGTISKDNGEIEDSTIDVAYYHNDIIGLAMGWVYRKDSSNLVSPEIFVNVTEDIFARGLVRYNYETEQTEYSEVSLVKQTRGMNIAFQYRKRHLREEDSYMLVFSLTDYPRANIALR